MSEYYAQRRTTIKDGVALVAFMLGWFAAAPFAWPFISAAFESGDPAGGVLRFLLVVFTGGVVFGALGLAVGHGAGYAWEGLHRRWRTTHAPIDRDEADRATAQAVKPRERLPLPQLRLELGDVDLDAYRALLEKTGFDVPDTARAAVALLESLTIGAWLDDGRLIGVARVYSDCAVNATLAELAVDPEFQHRGLGRMLLAKAYDATPRGQLTIVAPRGTGPFFEQAGADRALAAFVLRRPPRG